MANFELKFIDDYVESDFISCKNHICDDKNLRIKISGENEGEYFSIFLDKSTAIKFAKTLRTEINKITESELPIIQKGDFTTLTGMPNKITE